MRIKEKLLWEMAGYSLAFFFVSTLTLMFFVYILKQTPPLLLVYLSITSFGVFLVLVFLNRFLSIKEIDIDYFRNVMIGITGGLAVWVLLGVDFTFKEDFWLSINTFMTRLLIALIIILIGYSICKKKK